ncbi:MerR family transcriptional regulator [Marinospirillum perlucidum]|uniref:MerR family transcriptional regulator n=1 Tax=Marinospirillum perlucidum TaxID=1982602 RepID=UPI000DF16ED3|nr:helix-turn-helix domain-containing protein [Marinospirillum perlucidum]
MSAVLQIGEVARRSGCSRETLRHYEKLGLLSPPQRGEQGYRLYTPEDVERLAFIRHGRELGLELEAIRELLALSDHPDADCTAADDLASRHLQALEERIASLQALADELKEVVHQCRGGKIAECRIIKTLFESSEKEGGRESRLGSIRDQNP